MAFIPPLAFDPVQYDKGSPQGYLFAHDCPNEDDDFDPRDDFDYDSYEEG
jgi:hypothetical protein